jgi:hypothetical protein
MNLLRHLLGACGEVHHILPIILLIVTVVYVNIKLIFKTR